MNTDIQKRCDTEIQRTVQPVNLSAIPCLARKFTDQRFRIGGPALGVTAKGKQPADQRRPSAVIIGILVQMAGETLVGQRRIQRKAGEFILRVQIDRIFCQIIRGRNHIEGRTGIGRKLRGDFFEDPGDLWPLRKT